MKLTDWAVSNQTLFSSHKSVEIQFVSQRRGRSRVVCTAAATPIVGRCQQIIQIERNTLQGTPQAHSNAGRTTYICSTINGQGAYIRTYVRHNRWWSPSVLKSHDLQITAANPSLTRVCEVPLQWPPPHVTFVMQDNIGKGLVFPDDSVLFRFSTATKIRQSLFPPKVSQVRYTNTYYIMVRGQSEPFPREHTIFMLWRQHSSSNSSLSNEPYCTTDINTLLQQPGIHGLHLLFLVFDVFVFLIIIVIIVLGYIRPFLLCGRGAYTASCGKPTREENHACFAKTNETWGWVCLDMKTRPTFQSKSGAAALSSMLSAGLP